MVLCLCKTGQYSNPRFFRNLSVFFSSQSPKQPKQISQISRASKFDQDKLDSRCYFKDGRQTLNCFTELKPTFFRDIILIFKKQYEIVVRFSFCFSDKITIRKTNKHQDEKRKLKTTKSIYFKMSSRALRRLQEKELKDKSPAGGLNEEINENDDEEGVEGEETNIINSVKKKKKQKQKRMNMFDLVRVIYF